MTLKDRFRYERAWWRAEGELEAARAGPPEPFPPRDRVVIAVVVGLVSVLAIVAVSFGASFNDVLRISAAILLVGGLGFALVTPFAHKSTVLGWVHLALVAGGCGGSVVFVMVGMAALLAVRVFAG